MPTQHPDQTAGSLPVSEVAAMFDLVDRVTRAPDLTAYAQLTCQGILDLVPALSVSYNEIDPVSGRAYGVMVPDPGPGWFRTFRPSLEKHLADNPFIGHFMATGDTRVLSWGDPEIGTVHGTALDRTFYLPNGIRSQLAMTLPAPPWIRVGIAVNRGEEGFTGRDRTVLSLLRPHLAHAYRAVQLRNDHDLLRGVLGAQGWAVVLVDWDGRVVNSAPEGVSAVLRYGLDIADGASLTGGPLDEVRRIIQAYDPTTPAAASKPIEVVGPAGMLAAVVVPSVVGPHVVLLRAQPTAPAALMAVGLTPRQAEVAMGLVAGETNAQIGARLGIAPGTVKKHLEAVYARLGVGSRAAVVARISALVR